MATVLKPWKETSLDGCRWSGEVLEALGGSADVIAHEGESDYQGSATAVVLCGDGRLAIAEWSWGSCSGCDSWEAKYEDYSYGDRSSEEMARRATAREGLMAEVRSCVTFVESPQALRKYAEPLVRPAPESGSYEARYGHWMDWKSVIDWCDAQAPHMG